MIELLGENAALYETLGLKLFGALIMGIYVVFALVVMKQTVVMTKTLEVGFEKPIKLLATIHLFLAITTLIAALLLL